MVKRVKRSFVYYFAFCAESSPFFLVLAVIFGKILHGAYQHTVVCGVYAKLIVYHLNYKIAVIVDAVVFQNLKRLIAFLAVCAAYKDFGISVIILNRFVKGKRYVCVKRLF